MTMYTVYITGPGGIVTKFPYHNRVIAHFVGDKDRLKCTVTRELLYIHTVWSIRYKGSEEIHRVQNNGLFQLSGDRNLIFPYKNCLNIDFFVEELDGAVIFCGSYLNLTQVNVTLFVCGK